MRKSQSSHGMAGTNIFVCGVTGHFFGLHIYLLLAQMEVLFICNTAGKGLIHYQFPFSLFTHSRIQMNGKQ